MASTLHIMDISTSVLSPSLALSRTRLNQKGHTPVELTDPDQCVGCAFCATMCPDCVITVEK